MTRRDTQQALLEAGLRLTRSRGYHDTGINDVLAAAGVPKGSFYHHFSSKEDFGHKLLLSYNETALLAFRGVLGNLTLTPLERLETLFATLSPRLQQEGGCLIGNFSQELGGVNENLARACTQALDAQQQLIAECIAEGQERGEITRHASAEELSEVLLNAWQGVLLRMKATRERTPLDNFLKLFFAHFLRP